MKADRLNEQVRMKKVMEVLNNKLTIVLPDLMSSNTKLAERLKNKLKVSSLFNNIEQRNRKYLKGFIHSSNQRADFLKTGLKLNRAIRQSHLNMKNLCDQMEGDAILQNMDLFLNEKKLLNENTEQETHMKLNNLLYVMKQAIKPSLYAKKEENIKEIKGLTENEIDKVKNYIGNKLIKEQNNVNTNISNYVNKLNDTFRGENFQKVENKNKIKKDFNRFIETLNFQKDVKLINYQKPKAQQIKDKEGANLLRLKKLLYPTSLRKHELNKLSKLKNSKLIVKRNASMNNIYDNNISDVNDMLGKTTDASVADKIKNIDVTGQDTMQILNKLAQQKEYMSQRMENKLKRVNSLIEIKLPFLNNYELILNYVNRNKRNLAKSETKKETEDGEKVVFSPINDYMHNKKQLQPIMRKKLLAIKNDIQILDPKNELFRKKFYENEEMTIFNKLKSTLDKDYRYIREIHKINTNTNSSNNKDNNGKGEKVFITEKKLLI